MYLDLIKIDGIGTWRFALLLINVIGLIVWHLWRYFNPEKYSEQIGKDIKQVVVCYLISVFMLLFATPLSICIIPLVVLFAAFHYKILGLVGKSIIPKITFEIVLTFTLLVGTVIQDTLLVWHSLPPKAIFAGASIIVMFIYFATMVGSLFFAHVLAKLLDFLFPDIARKQTQIQSNTTTFEGVQFKKNYGRSYYTFGLSYAIISTLFTLIIAGVIVL